VAAKNAVPLPQDARNSEDEAGRTSRSNSRRLAQHRQLRIPIRVMTYFGSQARHEPPVVAAMGRMPSDQVETVSRRFMPEPGLMAA
jgi:hypothetical protein